MAEEQEDFLATWFEISSRNLSSFYHLHELFDFRTATIMSEIAPRTWKLGTKRFNHQEVINAIMTIKILSYMES